jgi:hypothetical protein
MSDLIYGLRSCPVRDAPSQHQEAYGLDGDICANNAESFFWRMCKIAFI